MSASVSKCGQCGAPLPAGTGALVCGFCGATTVVRPVVETKQLRAAVRQVLDEERRPRQAPTADELRNQRLVVWWLAGGIMAIGVLTGLVLTLSRPTLRDRPPAAVSRPRPPPVPPAPPPIVVPPTPLPPGIAGVQSLGLGVRGAYLVADGTLRKYALDSHEEVWRVAMPLTGTGDVVELKDHVAAITENGAAFFDANGASTGTFQFSHQGFKVSACAANDTEVLVKTVFDGTLRLDARTARRGQGRGGCATQEDLRCARGQRCGWNHGTFGDLKCRLELRTADGMVTFCEEEGSKANLVVLLAGGKPKWKSPRAGSSQSPSFASVLDGTLVVAEDALVEAFDAKTGTPRWTHAREGADRVISTDGKHLFVVSGGALVQLSADGVELARFRQSN